MEIYRLKEFKTSQLKKLYLNGNITEEQFNIADEFFKKYSAYEKEIDWNKGLKITWDELEKVIKKERNTKSQAKKKIRKGLEGFEEGKDYLVIGEGEYNGEPWVAYQPFTWEASRMIASHYVEPVRNEDGEIEDAGWCTAYQKNITYWDRHNEIEAFIYICGETIPTKKVAISISKEKLDASRSKFLYSLGSLNYNIWDFGDLNYTIKEKELLEVVPKLNYLIKRAYKNWEGKIKEQLLSKFKLNPKTNRYDYDGSLQEKELHYLVSEDGDGFTINFGKIKGSFDCSSLGLRSLKGVPQTVRGDFDCSWNNLISLKESPKNVGGNFYCFENQLISLEGAPQKVGDGFYCFKNQLTSLKGSPQKIVSNFNCSVNQLSSLEGSPHTIGGNFNCAHNYLISLKGSPQTVVGSFDCKCNYDLHSLEGIGEVQGKIYKDF